jgi:hypothetical protein
MTSNSLLPWITGSGFNPFNLAHLTDHRAGFLGINLPGALGPYPPPFTRAALRIIGSNSSSIPPFVDVVYKHLAANNLFSMLASSFLEELDSL